MNSPTLRREVGHAGRGFVATSELQHLEEQRAHAAHPRTLTGTHTYIHKGGQTNQHTEMRIWRVGALGWCSRPVIAAPMPLVRGGTTHTPHWVRGGGDESQPSPLNGPVDGPTQKTRRRSSKDTGRPEHVPPAQLAVRERPAEIRGVAALLAV